jgi:hypothetical protein
MYNIRVRYVAILHICYNTYGSVVTACSGISSVNYSYQMAGCSFSTKSCDQMAGSKRLHVHMSKTLPSTCCVTETALRVALNSPSLRIL